MSKTTVTWVQNYQFLATDSTHHSVVLSSAADNVGMKPSELLFSALGSCTGYDIVNILSKRKKNLTGLRVEVTGEQADEGWPRPYTAFHIHYVLEGDDLTEKEVERAITLSEEKFCSVSATLKGGGSGATITWDYEILPSRAPLPDES